jgi:hypothetical protein
MDIFTAVYVVYLRKSWPYLCMVGLLKLLFIYNKICKNGLYLILFSKYVFSTYPAAILGSKTKDGAIHKI